MRSSSIVSFVEKAAGRNMLDAWARPAIPQYTAVEAIVGAEIHDALTRRKSDRAALAAIQEAFDRLGPQPGGRPGPSAPRVRPRAKARLDGQTIVNKEYSACNRST